MSDLAKKFNFEKTLNKRLLPKAVGELELLLEDEDKKIKLAAIEDVLEMAGKRKRGSGGGGVTINLGDLAKGLRRVGGGKNENISEDGSKKIAPTRAVQEGIKDALRKKGFAE
jgi:hypothetical protein